MFSNVSDHWNSTGDNPSDNGVPRNIPIDPQNLTRREHNLFTRFFHVSMIVFDLADDRSLNLQLEAIELFKVMNSSSVSPQEKIPTMRPLIFNMTG